MLSMEQARLSFQFLAQVRNRFLDAYQQLMQMQI
jgi:flagellar hook-basal body complex protein FliE